MPVAENVRVRVLWLAKGLGPGGMERLLLSHAHFGDHTTFTYEAAYLRPDKQHLVPELAAGGVTAHCLYATSPYDVRWAMRLRRMLRMHQIDVLHVHSPIVAAIARLVSRTLSPRPKVIYTEHNVWPSYNAPTRWANRLTFRLDDVHVAVSEEVRASVPPRLQNTVETVIHGIDVQAVRAHSSDRSSVRRELGVDDNTVLIGIVANFREEKAYPDLLAAARLVIDQCPCVQFISVGQGPLEAEIRLEHDRLGLGHRFRFMGYRNDAQRVMAALDVFTLSSRFEGLPVTLMEARALGLPVVVTNVGGLPAYVSDGVDGLLVPPGQPRRLAEALTRIAMDLPLRMAMASASAAIAETFDARIATARLEELYLQAVSGTRPARR